MSTARRTLGQAGESRAAELLERDGWQILDRNFRAEFGEIDLVALDGSELVFVEVKARRAGSVRGPERAVMAVGHEKQRRLRRLAAAWLSAVSRPGRGTGLRFDVIGITFDRDGMISEIEHIRNAF